MTRRCGALTLALLLAPVVCAGQRLELRANDNLRVDAVYHLACLGESLTCTRAVFDRFWKNSLGWTEPDEAALRAWTDVMGAITAGAPARRPAPLPGNTPRFHPSQAARQRVIAAAVEARSADDLRNRSAGVLSRDQAVRLAAAIDHVERRIAPWWKSTRRADIRERTRAVRATAERTRVARTMSQVARFLESDLPDADLFLHAITPPEPQSKEYGATQIENHFFIELADEADTAGLVHVAVHELTHFLYDRAPQEKHLALIDSFVRSGSPAAPGLYTYLNEAIAIAAQALYAATLPGGKDDDGSYGHPYIGTLGTAAAPLLKTAVAGDGTLFSGFVDAYIAAGTAALGAKINEPRFILSQVALILPDAAEAIAARYSATMFPTGTLRVRSEDEAASFPNVNAVQFVRYDAFGDLPQRIPDLKNLLQRRGFAYALLRASGAHTYVLAGRDTAAILEAIDRLGSLERLGEGLLFAFD